MQRLSRGLGILHQCVAGIAILATVMMGISSAASLRSATSGWIKSGGLVRTAVPTDLVRANALEFTEDDTDPACASGNYNIYADLSETAIKVCQDGVTAVLGTGITVASGWVDSGTEVELTTSTDEVVLGGSTPINAAKFSIDGDSDQVQFAIQGNATQTTNIIEVENSGGLELFHLTSSGQLGLQHIATLADDHAIQITADAAGFGDVKGISLLYTTGAISGVEHADSVLVNIDQSASTGGDVMGFEVLATDSGGADVHGLNVGVGVSPIRQNSGVFGTVGFCEVETSGPTFTDCVTAFNSSGTDVQLWIANNDRVNIGHATTFEEISWLWDTVEGNPGIMPTFEYTTGVGPTWAVFTPTDGTNGARNNGIMEWDSSNLTGWSSESLDGDTAFWIRITRTCTPCTGPTEDVVEVSAPITFSWDKDGNITFNSANLDHVEFTEDDTDPTCASGDYNLFADLSDTKLKACENGVTGFIVTGGSGSLEWTDTGTVIHPAELTDDVSLGSATLINAAKLSVDGDADQVQFALQGNATQTSNLIEHENSAGTVLYSLDNIGIETVFGGIEFLDDDIDPACAAGDYNVYADLSETALKMCNNGTATVIGSTGAASVTIVPQIAAQNFVTGNSWVPQDDPNGRAWQDIVWAPELGLFVAIGTNGTGTRVMTSPDAVTWTERTSAEDNNWKAIAWSPDIPLLVAVADTGTLNRVMTSPDGINWTIRTSVGVADSFWEAVIWSPELTLFAAVSQGGTGNRVMTSPDGVTWTIRTSAADNFWLDIEWASELGLFVAIGTGGVGNNVMTSADGITWTTRTSAGDIQWEGIAWSPELSLLAVVSSTGTGNTVMTSPDAITWTLRASASDNDWRGVAWSPELGLFAAVGTSGSGDRIMTSSDGIVWALGTSPGANGWRDVTWSSELGIFAAVSASAASNAVMTSLPIDVLLFQNIPITLNAGVATDGDSILAILENTEPHASGSTNETAQLRFGFGNDIDVARIVVGKEDDYDPGAGENDSFMAFYTDKDGTATQAGRFNSDGSLILAVDLAVTEGGMGAGTFTDGGILLGSGTSAVTALGVAANGEIPIGDGATDPVLATITGTANEITVTNGAGSITLDLPDLILIGDTANANMAIGLTLNQGANDDQIQAYKSSDVDTGLTTIPDNAVEVDDYWTVGKFSGASGGVSMHALAEVGSGIALVMSGYVGAPQITDTTATTGVFHFVAVEHDGANALTAPTTDASIFTIAHETTSGILTRFVLKGDDGELHVGNTTLVVLDSHNDVALIADAESFRTLGQLEPDFATMNADGAYARLVDIGLVGAITEAQWNQGERPLVSMQRSIHLLNGSSRQAHGRLEAMLDVLEENPGFRAKMATAMAARGLAHLAR